MRAVVKTTAGEEEGGDFGGGGGGGEFGGELGGIDGESGIVQVPSVSFDPLSAMHTEPGQQLFGCDSRASINSNCT